MIPTQQFEKTTLLITHYNRSASLERLLSSFQKLNCKFEDIVVSDDGSRPEHLEQIKMLQQIFHFRLITTPKNKGLGNNINKGQSAVTTPYTLYVQEDFVPGSEFPSQMQDAIKILDKQGDIDMVRFYAYFKYPYLKSSENNFSEMIFKIWYPGYRKFHMYSDHPHLRRSSFLEKFGYYTEGVNVDKSEYRMVISFLQKKGKAVFHNDFRGLFNQENSAQEPSTTKRNFWRESNNPFVTVMRHIYRHLKFNYDYFFLKL